MHRLRYDFFVLVILFSFGISHAKIDPELHVVVSKDLLVTTRSDDWPALTTLLRTVSIRNIVQAIYNRLEEHVMAKRTIEEEELSALRSLSDILENSRNDVHMEWRFRAYRLGVNHFL